MKTGWVSELEEMVAVHGTVVRVTIIRADGSAPRGAGTSMMVGAKVFAGTIGGGAMEHEALKAARAMLSEQYENVRPVWQRAVRDFPLGPSLGQCCGGYVQLLFEVVSAAEVRVMTAAASDNGMALHPIASGEPMEFALGRKDDRDSWPLPLRRAVREMMSGAKPRKPFLAAGWYAEPLGRELAPLFLYGAGHVGRAAVKMLQELPFDIFWVDIDAERFPEDIPAGIRRLVANDPAQAARYAPTGAWHVVMTFSHAIDFDVCREVLARGDFSYLGVIASKTKRARFVRRLRNAGLPDACIVRLHAPIGLPGLEAKEPSVIALSLAADLLFRLQAKGNEGTLPQTEQLGGQP